MRGLKNRRKSGGAFVSDSIPAKRHRKKSDFPLGGTPEACSKRPREKLGAQAQAKNRFFIPEHGSNHSHLNRQVRMRRIIPSTLPTATQNKRVVNEDIGGIPGAPGIPDIQGSPCRQDLFTNKTGTVHRTMLAEKNPFHPCIKALPGGMRNRSWRVLTIRENPLRSHWRDAHELGQECQFVEYRPCR